MKSLMSQRLSMFAEWSVLITTVSILSYSLFKNSWSWSQVPVMSPRFGDLRLVTSAATCIQESRWEILGPTCDPFGRRFNYLPIWAQSFASLGLGNSQTVAVGLFLGVIVIVILATPLIFLVSQRASVIDVALVGLAVISPPVALQLERGNTESVILLLVALAVLLLNRLPSIAAGVLGLATGLKFFPLFTALSLVSKSRIRNLGVFACASAIIFFLNAKDLQYVIETQDPPGEYRFGSLLLLFHFFPVLLNFPRLWVLAAGVMLAIFPALIIWLVFKKQIVEIANAIDDETFSGVLVLVGGLVFVGTYLSGSRYDYSQIFLVMTLSGLAFVVKRVFIRIVLQGAGLISLWGAFSVNPEFVVGDLATSVVASVITAIVMQNRCDALRVLFRARTC